MFRRTISLCGLLLLTGALLTWTAGTALAHGGGHGGGGHIGGVGHFGGVGRIGIGNVGIGRIGGFSGGFRSGYNPGYYGSFYFPYSYGGYNFPLNYGGYSYPYSSGNIYPSALYYPYSSGPIVANMQSQPAPQADTTAHIHLSVPANAELWFSGEKMNSTGALRDFQSPPLQPGSNYSYEVVARWMKDGKEVTERQTVKVYAGADLTIRFPVPGQP